ncbi:MAG: carbohydrate-binding protein, partial [Glycomyces artemisiae]|nr:carbohydrate-binding protein [Glycomyces artemisiae]
RDAYASVEATSFDGSSTGLPVSGGAIGPLGNGDWVRYDDVVFGSSSPLDFVARVASGAAGGVSGLVEVRIDSRTAAPIGSFAVANTGGWTSWRDVPGNVASVTGTHDVYLTFTSGQSQDFVSVDQFYFRH